MGHIHRLYDFTVGGFIEHDKRLLLLFHRKLDTWMNVGGHVELDEDPDTALWREVYEETGLQQKNLSLVELNHERPNEYNTPAKMLPIPFDLTVYFSGESNVHQHIDLAYMMKSNTDEVTCNPRESADFKWFTLDELNVIQDDMFPNVYAQCVFSLEKLSLIKM
jgi:8-oxo-dGTP diphosphatase